MCRERPTDLALFRPICALTTTVALRRRRGRVVRTCLGEVWVPVFAFRAGAVTIRVC